MGMVDEYSSDDIDIEKYKYSYLSKTSKINRDIINQEKVLAKYFGDRWSDMPQDRQDLLLDFMFVDDKIREQYDSQSGNKFSSYTENSECESQESFPRLFLNSGQKINVDFESDLWTWRDEHSGPFSWYSRSQQDLTLADLEPDNISKPQPKSYQTDGEDSRIRKAEPQLTYPSSCWCHDVMNEFRKHEDKITISPSTSMILPKSRVTEDEIASNVNPVTEESSDTFSEQVKQHEVREEEDASPDKNGLEKKVVKNKGRRSRSPSPKKMHRSGSLGRSSIKTSEANLIIKHDEDTNDSNNVFSNTAMESEWSTFVGEAKTENRYEPNVMTNKPETIKSAPHSLVIDRGGGSFSPSPYNGDRDRLIQPQSPLISAAIASAAAYSSPMSGSGESSPDHTTFLLKGMQTPVQCHTNPQYINSQPLNCVKYPDNTQSELDMRPPEEVLRVETSGDKVSAVTITSHEQNNRDSIIPETGYDFLDNW